MKEIQPGKLWLGSSQGYSVGGEPRAIARSANNQVWIGTANRGVDIFKLGR